MNFCRMDMVVYYKVYVYYDVVRKFDSGGREMTEERCFIFALWSPYTYNVT